MSVFPDVEDSTRVQSPAASQKEDAISKVKDDVSSIKSETSTAIYEHTSLEEHWISVE